jgi:hypothetical protein
VKILNRFTGDTIFEAEAETMRELVAAARKSGANLFGADLSGANLSGADLPGANLPGANLSGADLPGANLSGANLFGADLPGANLPGANLSRANLSGADLPGANLSGANLSGANLFGADLSGAKINWQSHTLLSEILKRAAGDSLERRMVAGLIAISTDWCWDQLLQIDHAEKEWALRTLAACVVEGDSHPAVLDGYIQKDGAKP